MRKINIFIIIVLIPIMTWAQKSSSISQIARSIDKQNQWIQFRKQIPAVQVFKYYHSEFGLGAGDEMLLSKQETDKLGYTHYRFQQFHHNVKIEGAEATVHALDGYAYKANVKIISGISEVLPSITAEQSLQYAKQNIGAQQYMWENALEEAELKRTKNNPNATYQPKPELVYYNSKHNNISSDYKLTWKVLIYASQPLSRNLIYVDATTGQIIRKIDMLQSTDVPASAITKYNGTQTIVADYTGSLYRLREETHGNGIQTYSMNNQMNYTSATDITDTDTVFNGDDIANNAHWATIKTYEYYLQKHGRNSYNNQGGILRSYVHYGTDYANAFWDGSRMTYGDGQGGYSAFTTLDICGHEISHGVTEYSANLIYELEPGALNEAFSDIFGCAIEFFADDSPNWDMGEDIGTAFRSMSDPKSKQQPDTYKGQYWESDPNQDNGGVHTNSGIANYWFYLLCDGGSGTNDNGYSYTISPIGMDKAEQIAYRMLTVYLTTTSQFADAYYASLMSAEDLYGACSEEVKACAAAWAAVGVGFPISNEDVYFLSIDNPVTACGLSLENVSIRLYFNGCDTLLQPGTIIPVAYSLDGNAMVHDTILISDTLDGRDTISFTFTTPVDVAQTGIHSISCWARLGNFDLAFTDSIMNYTFNSKLQQNFDFGISKVLGPHSACMLQEDTVRAVIGFYGCDSIAAGTQINLAYSLDGGAQVEEQFTLPSTMFPNNSLEVTFATPVDLSVVGNHIVNVYNTYAADTFNTNDALVGHSLVHPYTIATDTFTFSESNIDLFMIKEKGQFANIFFNMSAANGSGKGMDMTGGNAMTYYDQLEIATDTSEVWNVNEILSAKAHFCIDGTNWTEGGTLLFDLKQTHGGQLYSQYLGGNIDDFKVASNFRVLFNGNQVSRTYNPVTPGQDAFKTQVFDLSAYQGSQFVITLESRNISKDTTISIIPFKMDNAYIDNLKIVNSVVGIDENSVTNNSFQLYPNPAQQNVEIEFALLFPSDCSVQLTDVVGNVVYISSLSGVKGQNHLSIDISEFTKGIYMLHLITDKSTIVSKLVKQ